MFDELKNGDGGGVKERRSPFSLAPNFPSISAYRSAPSNSRVLKSFFFSYQFSDIGFFQRRVSLHIPRLIEHEIFDGFD